MDKIDLELLKNTATGNLFSLQQIRPAFNGQNEICGSIRKHIKTIEIMMPLIDQQNNKIKELETAYTKIEAEAYKYKEAWKALNKTKDIQTDELRALLIKADETIKSVKSDRDSAASMYQMAMGEKEALQEELEEKQQEIEDLEFDLNKKNTENIKLTEELIVQRALVKTLNGN